MGGSNSFGKFQSVIIDIDHDDIGWRIKLRGEQGTHADRAGTDNRYIVSWFDLTILHANFM